MVKIIIDYLKEIGLSEIESLLYQGLLETGPTTIMGLSEHTGIKRITTHFNINNLIEKGLVVQTVHGARRQISAEPPERLEYLIKHKLTAAKELQEKFDDFLKAAKTVRLSSSREKDVEIKYYEGKKAVMSIYLESLEYDDTYSFADLDRYYEIYPNTNPMWNQAITSNPKREVWDIIVDSPLARKIGQRSPKRYHVKFISRAKYIRNFKFSDYLVFGDKLVIIQLDLGNIVATVIESKHVAMTMKAIHRYMWELLPIIR